MPTIETFESLEDHIRDQQDSQYWNDLEEDLYEPDIDDEIDHVLEHEYFRTELGELDEEDLELFGYPDDD